MLVSVSLVAVLWEAMRMSRRNTRQGKAWRRAERERRRRSLTSDQGPRAVEVQVAPRPGGAGPRNSDERSSGLRSNDGLIAVEPGDADLDANADPGDFGGLDADDADLQAALTVLAVLADDVSDVAEVADDLVGDVGGPDVAEDLEDAETGQLSAEADAGPESPGVAGARVVKLSPEAGGADEEIFVVGDDDDDDDDLP